MGILLTYPLSSLRCGFLGSLDSRINKHQQQPQLSKLLDTLRPPLHSCRGPNKAKKQSVSFVCCENKNFANARQKNKELFLDEYEDFYQYEEMEDFEFYDEETDLNFDKVIVYSHRNAPGGR